ncbi:MAG: C25 family cysteine peptidase [Candidatus Tectomicrobia bacterium]|nr:C25 family cysteine peptidase [Candidatus Tectomicrobia bacterium]
MPPHDVQHHLAAAPAVQILIRETGWYRVMQPDLVRSGLDPGIDPRRLQLFIDGQQQSITVMGGADGRFDPQDAIEFYGTELDTPWTDTHTYWLVAGSQPGQRMPVGTNQRQGTTPPSSFPATMQHKKRMLYLAMIKNGEAENFFGALVATERVEEVLSLHHLTLSPPADAQLEVILQGVTTGSHQVAVQLNEYEVGTIDFSGQTREAGTFSFPQTWLREGENVIGLEPTGDEADVNVVETIRLTYWRPYTADDDTLRFPAPERSQVTVAGFSQPDIRVVDITSPQAVRELVGQVAAAGTGHAVTVTADGEGERILLAFTDAQVKQPSAIMANTPSTWHHPTREADLVIISHGEFLDSIAPLKLMRESQGWVVALIDVEDIYDEYNFGAKSPWALRNFLHHASTAWFTPPRFVLLVGDASFDSRNYLELDDVDFVPTQIVETAFLETASDDALVDFDEDGVPDLAIGRLPVQTVEEADTVVAKLVGYAEAGAGESWTREALFVADANDIFDFAAASAAVSTLLPPELIVEELWLDQPDTASLRSGLLTGLNQGKLLVNYIGHGSVEVWSGGELLTSADARALTNGAQLPVVVAMNCLNGFFHDLYTESLAEALLKAPQGGAIAVWASSGLTVPSGQVVMNQELMRHLFGEERLVLGEAIVRAKAAVTDRDVQRTWLLFGDPLTTLK